MDNEPSKNTNPKGNEGDDFEQGSRPATPIQRETTAIRTEAHVVFLIVLVLALGIYLLSGLTKIEQNQMGVLTRFGQIEQELEPGLEWAMPWPIDEVYREATFEVKAIRLDDFNVSPEELKETKRFMMEKYRWPKEIMDALIDPNLVTGDKNLIHMALTVRYRVTDPRIRLQVTDDYEKLLRYLLTSSLIRQIADRRVMYAITTGRNYIPALIKIDTARQIAELSRKLNSKSIRSFVKELNRQIGNRMTENQIALLSRELNSHLDEQQIRRLIASINADFAQPLKEEELEEAVQKSTALVRRNINIGLVIESIDMRESRPPEIVRRWFEELQLAIDKRRKAELDAQAEFDRIVRESEAEARKIELGAYAYRNRMISKARGETDSFKKLLTQYRRNPALVKMRMYLDTIGLLAPKWKQSVVRTFKDRPQDKTVLIVPTKQ
jgi:regulator of protease activity HflC (stomatin/prohibitin superfamily)